MVTFLLDNAVETGYASVPDDSLRGVPLFGQKPEDKLVWPYGLGFSGPGRCSSRSTGCVPRPAACPAASGWPERPTGPGRREPRSLSSAGSPFAWGQRAQSGRSDGTGMGYGGVSGSGRSGPYDSVAISGLSAATT